VNSLDAFGLSSKYFSIQLKQFSHPEDGYNIFLRNVGLSNHYTVQNPKRRPGRAPFEQFITFASIKPSGLVGTRKSLRSTQN
jgi:hypothetical protein